MNQRHATGTMKFAQLISKAADTEALKWKRMAIENLKRALRAEVMLTKYEGAVGQ